MALYPTPGQGAGFFGRSTGVPNIDTSTIFFRFRIVGVAGPDAQTLFGLWCGGTKYINIGWSDVTDGSGDKNYLYIYGSNSGNDPYLEVPWSNNYDDNRKRYRIIPGTWYDVCLVNSAGARTLYVGPTGTPFLYSNSDTARLYSTATTDIGWPEYVNTTEDSNAEYDNIKEWTVALTEDEIQRERLCRYAVKTDNLNALYPMLSDTSTSECYTDYSGNGYNLTTVEGTVTAVPGAPVPVTLAPTPLVGNKKNVFYGFNFTPKTFTGTGNAVIPLDKIREGESALLAISYTQSTSPTTPTGWTVVTDTVIGSDRRQTNYTKKFSFDTGPESLTISLNAATHWVAHLSYFTGSIVAAANVTTSSGNIFTAPSVSAPSTNSYVVQLVTNGTANAKTLINLSNIRTIESGVSGNVTRGVGSAMAVFKVASAGNQTGANVWGVYPATTSNTYTTSEATSPLNFFYPTFNSNVRYNSIRLQNVNNGLSTPIHLGNVLYKADTANVLNYNGSYTIMFNAWVENNYPGTGSFTQRMMMCLGRKWGTQIGDWPNSTNDFGIGDLITIADSIGAEVINLDVMYGDTQYGNVSKTDTFSVLTNGVYGRWHNFALVRDNTHTTTTLWINGECVAALDKSYVGTRRASKPADFHWWGGRTYAGIDQSAGAGNQGTVNTGYIAQVRMNLSNIKEWSVALKGGEILEEMKSFAPKHHTSNLFAWYPTIGNTLSELLLDRGNTQTKHLQMINNGGILPSPIVQPDTAIATSIVIEPANVYKAINITGNIFTVPEGSEKSRNVLVILPDGSLVANVRAADFYANYPSGKAVIMDRGNLRVLSNTEILIR